MLIWGKSLQGDVYITFMEGVSGVSTSVEVRSKAVALRFPAGERKSLRNRGIYTLRGSPTDFRSKENNKDRLHRSPMGFWVCPAKGILTLLESRHILHILSCLPLP